MASILYPKDFKDMPWKNGLGSTTEIFRLSHENNPEEFYFRISAAPINESASFSLFPGKDRFLMLLEGKGLRLTFDDQSEIILKSQFDSFEFEGEESPSCELIQGPCLDFNVMTERHWGQSQVTLTSLKMNQIKKYCPKAETYLYLYQASPKLIILKANENYELKASEHMTVIEVELIKSQH